MHNIKIVANYLPQFHTIPENDEWWGNGFTDWTAVQNAKPMFNGHVQPRTPLNGYYDLSCYLDVKNQVDLANEYGIYGFAIYHYWFNSDLCLLSKPAEIIKDNPELDIHYLFLWDNQSWKRTWSNVKKGNDWAPKYDGQESETTEDGVLAELVYGSEDEWKEHFNYLLQFFRDERYIKIDGKPIFGFFNSTNSEDREILQNMSSYWDALAKDYGLPGVICMGRETHRKNTFDYKFQYSPFINNTKIRAGIHRITDEIKIHCKKIRFYNYDDCWGTVIRNAKRADGKTILSGFVNFDDSPRRGEKGRIILGGTPKKFEKHLVKLISILKKQGKDMLFITAWNEWGEGAYLEPDVKEKYSYLEVIKKVVEQNDFCGNDYI